MLRKMSRARYALAPAMLAITLCLSACADIGADYRPVVDMRRHAEAAYDGDVAACQQTARAAPNTMDVAEESIVKNCMRARGYTVLG